MAGKDRAKAACLILFFAALLWVLLTGKGTVRMAQAFAEGPNAGVTGAPGEPTCALVGCHGGEPNTGPGQFFIIAPSVYEPGKTYSITVKHVTTDTSRKRWGFQLTALDGGSSRAGNLQNLSSLTQVLDGGPGGNRLYVEHAFLGTFPGQMLQASWAFNWIAPSSDVGAVTMYAAGNQANNDGNNTGDQIYTTTAMIFSGPPEIDAASVNGKRLIVIGKNFADGAALLMDGGRVRKVSNDSDSPTTMIAAKKAGRDIQPGQTVSLQVVNPDNTASNAFSFTRPAG